MCVVIAIILQWCDHPVYPPLHPCDGDRNGKHIRRYISHFVYEGGTKARNAVLANPTARRFRASEWKRYDIVLKVACPCIYGMDTFKGELTTEERGKTEFRWPCPAQNYRSEDRNIRLLLYSRGQFAWFPAEIPDDAKELKLQFVPERFPISSDMFMDRCNGLRIEDV